MFIKTKMLLVVRVWWVLESGKVISTFEWRRMLWIALSYSLCLIQFQSGWWALMSPRKFQDSWTRRLFYAITVGRVLRKIRRGLTTWRSCMMHFLINNKIKTCLFICKEISMIISFVDLNFTVRFEFCE